jgi:hypothetical protein
MAYKADWSSTDQIPRRAVDAGLIGRFGAIDPTVGGSSSRYSLSGEWRGVEGETSRALSVYAIKSRLYLFSNFTFFLDDPVNGDQFEQAESRVTLGAQASQSWSGTIADRHAEYSGCSCAAIASTPSRSTARWRASACPRRARTG